MPVGCSCTNDVDAGATGFVEHVHHRAARGGVHDQSNTVDDRGVEREQMVEHRPPVHQRQKLWRVRAQAGSQARRRNDEKTIHRWVQRALASSRRAGATGIAAGG